jgi:hypothetical protein
MPIVPTQDSFTVAPAAQGARTFGAPQYQDYAGAQARDMSQAFGKAGSDIYQAEQKAQLEADSLRVNEAMNQAQAARMKLTYDKDIGFSGIKGKAALDPDADGKAMDQKYGESFNKEVDAIRASLGNERQRKQFNAHVGSVSNQFTASLQSHMLQEKQTYENGVRVGTIEVAQNMGAQEWNNPQSVAQSRGAIKAAIDSDKSLSPELRAATLVKALTPMHSAIVATAIENGNIDYAKQHMAEYGKELTEEARVRLQGALDMGARKEKVQTFGDDVMAKGLDLSAALAMAREKFSGQDEDAAIREVKERFTEKEFVATKDVKELGKSAWSSVMSTGKLTATMTADLTVKAPEELRQIRDWLDQKRRQAKAELEGGSAAELGHYYGLRRMSMEEPEKFASLDLMKSEPYLAKGDFKHLTEIQVSIGKGDAKAMETQRVVRSTLGAIRAEVAAVGIDLTPKEGTKQAKETAQFMDVLTRSLDQATREKGKPLTPEEARRIGMSLVREGVEQGSGIFGFGQTKKKGYQIASDPSISEKANFVAKRFSDIPKATRDMLVNEYRTRNNLGNRQLTDDQEAAIERAYTKGIDQGKF